MINQSTSVQLFNRLSDNEKIEYRRANNDDAAIFIWQSVKHDFTPRSEAEGVAVVKETINLCNQDFDRKYQAGVDSIVW